MRYFCLLALALILAGCGPKKEEPVTNATTPVTTPTTSPQTARTTPLSAYGRASISVAGKEIDVYVADETAERTEGLMFVKEGELKPDEGMLFVFANVAPLSFWMENTLLPLDIAYLDETGKILNIRQMQPLDRSPQPSSGPAKYALEMHEGWFEKQGIKAGAKADLSAIK